MESTTKPENPPPPKKKERRGRLGTNKEHDPRASLFQRLAKSSTHRCHQMAVGQKWVATMEPWQMEPTTKTCVFVWWFNFDPCPDLVKFDTSMSSGPKRSHKWAGLQKRRTRDMSLFQRFPFKTTQTNGHLKEKRRTQMEVDRKVPQLQQIPGSTFDFLVEPVAVLHAKNGTAQPNRTSCTSFKHGY